MAKVTIEVAKKELAVFIEKSGIDLDYEIKDIKSLQTESEDEDRDNIYSIKKILKLQMKGLITVSENGELTLKLRFPLSTPETKELRFLNRINTKVQKEKLTKYKADDMDGRVIAVTAARTGNNTGLIEALDQMDYNNAALITGLFL